MFKSFFSLFVLGILGSGSVQAGLVDCAGVLFDPEGYLRHNTDVKNANMDACFHFTRHGKAEGRDPNPFKISGETSSGSGDLKACIRGPNIGEISNVNSTSLAAKFDGEGIYEIKYSILNDSNAVVSSGSINPKSNTLNVSYPALQGGNYTLVFKGGNCSGGNSQRFVVNSSSNTPLVSPVNPPVVSGDLKACVRGPNIGEISNVNSTSLIAKFDGEGIYEIKYSILNDSNAVVSSGSINPKSNTLNVSYPALQGGNYTLVFKGGNCSGGNSQRFVVNSQVNSPVVSPVNPPVGSGDLKACIRGPNITNISNVSSTSLKAQFDGEGIYEIKYSILNDSNAVLGSGSINPQSNTLNVSYGTLQGGNYTLVFKGGNCSGGNSQRFVVNSTSNPPVNPPVVTPGGTTTVVDGNVKITEPNKPPYYYSDNKHPSYYDNKANLPVIFKNKTTYSDDDVVFLENDKIKIGINLTRGGHIAYAGIVGKDFNYVNNGYDGGRQIGLDAYQKPEIYTQNGKTSRLPDKSYNVTLGGDIENNAVTLIDYRRIGNSYYVKLRPNFYLLDSEISETYIESTYTLMGNAVKVDYKYTSFRTDNQLKISGQFDFVGWAIPAMFVSDRLTRYATYTGDQPFQRGPIEEGQIPTAGVCAMPTSRDTKEFWGAVYNPSTGLGIGVANREPGAKSLHIPFKQCEVYAGNPSGSTYDMGFTYFGPTFTLIVPDGSNFVREDTAYVLLGTVQEIRDGAYRVLGH